LPSFYFEFEIVSRDRFNPQCEVALISRHGAHII